MTIINKKTPLVYYGGKQTMLKDILPLVPEHNIYTEAYAGGAALLFAKPPAKLEVINDLNAELVNFYRVCKQHPKALIKEVQLSLHSRHLHSYAYNIYTCPMLYTPVQRAWALWYSLKVSFSAQLGGSFSYDRLGKKPKALRFAIQAFNADLLERLQHVTIENKEAKDVVKTFDKPDSFHFIDPPYVGCNMGHYAGMFNEQNLHELLELLTTLQGKFMLTMYPNELIQSYVDKHHWHIHEVQRTVTAAKTKRRKQAEWMVCNYTV